MPTSAETVANGEHYLKMTGPEVFRARGPHRRRVGDRHARHGPASPSTTSRGSCPTRPTSVSSRPPPPASGIPAERTLVNIDHYGNTERGLDPARARRGCRRRPPARRRPRAAVRVRCGHDLGQRAAALGPRVTTPASQPRVAFVTGASQGIGRAIARRARRGGSPGRVLLLVRPRRRQGDAGRGRSGGRRRARGAGRRRRRRIGRRTRSPRSRARSGRSSCS